MLITRSLTAAEAGQVGRAGDFHWTRDRELLTLPVSLCSTSEARARCGCGRSFSGAATLRATTVAVVHDEPEEHVRAEFAASALHGQWARLAGAEPLWREQILALTAALLRVGVVPGDLVRVDNTPDGSTIHPAGALADLTC